MSEKPKWERERMEQRQVSQPPDRHFRWVLALMLALAVVVFAAAVLLGVSR